MKSVEDITRDLVRLHSSVGRDEDEQAVAAYIFEFLTTYTSFRVEKQPVINSRYNVIARADDQCAHLLLAGHMDTVDPKTGWGTRDQYGATEESGRLYGLGSLDMKSGIAAILSSVASMTEPLSGLELLFYCDEEYDFEGMKSYIDHHKGPHPRRCVITEPTDLKPQRSHRGLVELRLAVHGVTGHASRPDVGNNAIDGLCELKHRLVLWLRRFRSSSLGIPTVNLAYMRGGLDRGDKDLGQEGNNIADWAEAVIEVRTTTVECRADTILGYLERQAEDLGLLVDGVIHVRHDLGSLEVDEHELDFLTQALEEAHLPTEFRDAKTLGYGDGQLIRKAWGIPVAYLGPKGDGMHAVGEYVELASLPKLTSALTSLIRVCCLNPTPTRT